VGEGQSSLEIISALPEAGYAGPKALSVGTPAGLLAAQKRIWPSDRIFDLQFPNLPPALDNAPKADPALSPIQLMAPPLDCWGAPGRCLERLDPSGLVIVETEIWPELLFQCRKRKVPVAIVSGRLGEKSMRLYLRLKSLIGPLLRSTAVIGAAAEEDKERFLALGASPGRVMVTGSPKFDPLIAIAKERLAKALEGRNGPGGQTSPGRLESQGGPESPDNPVSPLPLIVAGSTHPGEEELVISALGKKLPSRARLILAPRHVVRAEEVLALVRSQGLKARLWSEGGEDPEAVAVLDQVGVLAGLYEKADLCVVGGGFFRGSGHNPFEPAALGRPIIFGPGMSSFEGEAKALVANGAALKASPSELGKAVERLLEDGRARSEAAMAGLKTVAGLEPASPALARLIVETILHKPPSLSSAASEPSGGPG
jgi:3-deoxy-D-manno-octulosonic-acid transferase